MFDSYPQSALNDAKELSASGLVRFPSLHSIQLTKLQTKLDSADALPKSAFSLDTVRSSYSFQHVLRKTQKHRDTCIEVLRSFGLFISLSKLLAYIASFLLTLTNNDPLETILVATSKDIASMHQIPTALHLIAKVVLLEIMFQCACGIYGYVRFNKGFLFFYGFAMIFMMISELYATIILNTRDTTDIFRVKLFTGYRDHGTGDKAVFILQKIAQCCRSKIYGYENVTELPESCCPNLNITEGEKCVHEKAYNRTCRTKRDHVISSLKKAKLYDYIASLAVGLFFLHLSEAILAFAMVWYLEKRKRGKSKAKEFVRKKSTGY